MENSEPPTISRSALSLPAVIRSADRLPNTPLSPVSVPRAILSAVMLRALMASASTAPTARLRAVTTPSPRAAELSSPLPDSARGRLMPAVSGSQDRDTVKSCPKLSVRANTQLSCAAPRRSVMRSRWPISSAGSPGISASKGVIVMPLRAARRPLVRLWALPARSSALSRISRVLLAPAGSSALSAASARVVSSLLWRARTRLSAKSRLDSDIDRHLPAASARKLAGHTLCRRSLPCGVMRAKQPIAPAAMPSARRSVQPSPQSGRAGMLTAPLQSGSVS